MSDGRLAQLVAHPLDVREVTSSSLVSSTTDSALKSAESFYFYVIYGTFVLKKLPLFLRRPTIEFQKGAFFAFYGHLISKKVIIIQEQANSKQGANDSIASL